MVSHFARQLRTNMTDAERRLWARLRRTRPDGHRLRRQVPIGPYIADFACHAVKVIIEVDGGQHSAEKAYDDRRTAWLEARGYRVLRYWNSDVLMGTD